jgi:hypothetical protein
MLDHTTNPIVRNPRDLPLRALSTIGSKIFRAGDYHAREHGRQSTPRHGGLRPTYTDLVLNRASPERLPGRW